MIKSKANELLQLRCVGRAALEDFRRLGVTTLKQLCRSNPQTMYDRLCRRKMQSEEARLHIGAFAHLGVLPKKDAHFPLALMSTISNFRTIRTHDLSAQLEEVAFSGNRTHNEQLRQYA